MAMRDTNSDAGKLHGQPRTKAQAAVQMPIWPTMGAWKAPGQTVVPPSSPENDDYQEGQRSDNDADDPSGY